MTTEAKFKYALKEMMLNKPLSEINVTLLCNKCHCHRQTFYYHYQDIYDLLSAIFLNENVEGLDKAQDPNEILMSLINYSKVNFVFIRSTYNSAANELVDDFFYSKIMTRLFNILSLDNSNKFTKDGCRDVARRFAKVVSDEFGYWFRNVSVTPARFERIMKKFSSDAITYLLPAMKTMSAEEHKK